MTTLTTEPLAPLLDRLFAEAALARPEQNPMFAGMAERASELMRSKSGHVELYGHLKDYPLPVSRETGVLLYMLARSFEARAIIEFGTSFGISTLFLAAALRDNGGGRLITTEFEPSKVARARKHLAEGGLADLVEIREGDALQTLSPTQSAWSCSTAPSRSMPTFSRCSRAASAGARSSSPTMPTTVLITSPMSALRPTAICRCRSATTSSCRCGSGEVWLCGRKDRS